MAAFILTFACGAALAALLPVGPFLAVVALAGTVSIGIAVVQGSALIPPVLRVSGEAACAQIGYIVGIVCFALFARLRSRRRDMDRN